MRLLCWYEMRSLYHVEISFKISPPPSATRKKRRWKIIRKKVSSHWFFWWRKNVILKFQWLPQCRTGGPRVVGCSPKAILLMSSWACAVYLVVTITKDAWGWRRRKRLQRVRSLLSMVVSGNPIKGGLGSIFDPPEGKDYKWYVSGIYCQLGDYMAPTT